MFDDSFIIDKFTTIWEKVYTDVGIPNNVDNIIKYQSFRGKEKFQTPSIFIYKNGGIVNVENAMRGETLKHPELGLLRIWNRVVNIGFDIITRMRGEDKNKNLYSSRLWSLFLREWEYSPSMDIGTDDIADASVDQLRLGTVSGNIRESKTKIVEFQSRMIEILTISIDMQFYEYAQLPNYI